MIDVLNIDLQMEHHYSAYGFHSPAVGDYVDMNIMSRLATPEGQALLSIVDPYDYRDRFASIPKLMINATGDEFFLPDSAQYYFHDLPGERLLRYVPNTDHGLGGSDALDTLQIFYASVVDDALDRPEFSWEVQPDRSIRVQTVTPPDRVDLWRATDATNPDVRIFMHALIGYAWSSSPLTDQGGGVYVGQVADPPAGWTAFFVQLEYDTPLGIPFKFTTEVGVTPE